ncbi:serine/threonine protein kinase [Martiniozyma asiatica (nom. inval.)]|nr:serine/threonine protein kinase [Martiniozyma asiatica]
MNATPLASEYKPGTRLTVGNHQAVVTKYISKGGFATVYQCTISPPVRGSSVACLKRVAVPDKQALTTLRREVEAMRRLQNKSYIVSYIDSHAARLANGHGYEVFVLMEFCNKGGLIDFMNTRLVNRLNEKEILNIFYDITTAVGHMHTLNPPILHRDIKIENVLLADDGSYKLCDFGSASSILKPARNVEEFQILQDDILKNTTPQYRSPEMIDLYKRQPIDDKSDVWALGVFLYKLCYFTTPFENNGGDVAIVNCTYRFPPTPVYSGRLKNIIAKILVPNASMRPSVFQLLSEVSKMRGLPCPNFHTAAAVSLPKPNHNSFTSTNTMPTAAAPLTNLETMNLSASSLGAPPTRQSYSSLASPVKPYLNNQSSSPVSVMSSYSRHTNISASTRDDQPLPQPKLRSNRRRPVSMYAENNNNNNNNNNRDSMDLSHINNLINDIATQEIVDLSPKLKQIKNENSEMHNSMDFVKSLSRQSSGLQRTGSSIKKWKRASITSLKDLLTGGSNHNGRSGSRNASTSSVNNNSINSNNNNNNITNNNGSSGNLQFKFNERLDDLQEMSPENKSPVKPSGNAKLSIQERTAKLFRRSSGVETKTAHGYGKYTDNISKVKSTSNSQSKSSTSLPQRNISDGATTVSNTGSNYTMRAPVMISSVSSASTNRTESTSSSGSTSLAFDKASMQHSSNAVKSVQTKFSNSPTMGKKMPPPKPKKPIYLQSQDKEVEDFIKKYPLVTKNII